MTSPSFLLAPPSAPYDISLLSCDGQSMLLTWKKPLVSGGSDIKDYYVDKRRSGTSEWREVHIPPLSERVYQVHRSHPLTLLASTLRKRS